jgi:8-oxo-dGTP diphosphatase
MTPFKISVLVFLRDARGRQLLIKRSKAPNLGCWSPIGGKLEMERGESPFECAVRETAEEVGLTLAEADLHLFGYISEKNYEGGGHWLMFLFDCRKVLPGLPPNGDEGEFGFFTRTEIEDLAIPPTDRVLVWPWYDKHRNGFVALRADCAPNQPLDVFVEQVILNKASRNPFNP